ncbi:uncharacterized protein LDX57_011268 [Aspergillus melleus]|uniref:uncharacterized protein n=1 Tax=Aspergillus melleus TaxID=138277 RepID=UPI001E8D66B7|nr:uncharacterized protein LDX57_011268 [Aspergillus melleus]KAH8433634.1 hypothetical protein LDX57_011268 [Aspergillus melleus]
MPILDKENRPRGLRMPSLSAIKGGLRKQQSSEPSPQKDFEPVQLPAASLYPTDTVPVLPSTKPQEKELPPNPTGPPSFPSPPASSSPAVNTNGYNDRPLPRFPRVPVPKPEEPIAPAVLQETPLPIEEPKLPAASGLDRPQNAPPQHNYIPYHPGPSPGQSDDTDDPLEDFIPEPEPEPETEADAVDAPIEPVSSEENNGPWTPPDYEPVAAPLNKLHYACYQGHRSMPVANNAWYPVPCMTCQRFDREVRYRCVFCCLRICGSCSQTLQKLPNRSLNQLMETINSPE